MRLKKHIIYSCLGTLMTLSLSCRKEQCLKGNNYVQKQEVEVNPFTAVSANLSATVELVHDTSSKAPFVEIISEENVAEHIGVNVVNDMLKLDLGFCFTQHKDINIIVHYDTLNTIHLKGPSEITTQQIMQQDMLTLINEGSGTINVNVNAQHIKSTINANGSIYINGHVTNHISLVNGTGKINGYNCFVENHQAQTNGSGYTYSQVNSILGVNITGSGNVYYRGNPLITDTISGSGRIINAN